MRTIELTYPHSLLKEDLPEAIAAIGFFDGIHKGHQQVIQEAVTKAKERNVENAVITFHPHPSVVLKKDVQQAKYITSLQQKQETLQRMDVDRLYIITFDKELASLEPQKFIEHFIIGLNIIHLVAGFDFTFGFKGSGNMTNIGDYTRGLFDYTIISKVEIGQEKISSTRIRKLLRNGQVQEANDLLGRPLTVRGVVIEGDKRGRTIGYPTANIQASPEILLPKVGVYAVRVKYKNEVYEGMANLGYNPTFRDDIKTPCIEVNIFDYNNDLYGEELEIEWHCFIRDEKKFDSADPLIEKIAEDEKIIRAYFYS